MREQIVTNYRGIDISYDETNETWQCEIASKSRSSQNLKNCKAAIDKYLNGETKVKEKFQRFDVITEKWGDEYQTVTITSITDEETIWIVDESGSRSKKNGHQIKRVYPITPENTELFKKIAAKKKEIKELDTEMANLKNSLIPLDVKKIYADLNPQP